MSDNMESIIFNQYQGIIPFPIKINGQNMTREKAIDVKILMICDVKKIAISIMK
jgi:hypothetical protein